MELTAEEQAMLNGEPGGPVKRAIELQIEVGKFYSAKRFVPVTNVHMMGDIEVMGDGGLEHLRCFAEQHARCVVNTTTNARCFDFAHVDALKQDKREAEKELQLIGYETRLSCFTLQSLAAQWIAWNCTTRCCQSETLPEQTCAWQIPIEQTKETGYSLSPSMGLQPLFDETNQLPSRNVQCVRETKNRCEG